MSSIQAQTASPKGTVGDVGSGLIFPPPPAAGYGSSSGGVDGVRPVRRGNKMNDAMAGHWNPIVPYRQQESRSEHKKNIISFSAPPWFWNHGFLFRGTVQSYEFIYC